MTYILAVLLTLLNAGAALLVLVGLPGTWLIVIATLLVAWWRWDSQMFSPATLITLVALAALGEIVEFLAGVIGTRQAGGSRKGTLGALAGTLIGGVAGTSVIPVPLLGSLLGACLGAALGAWLMELRAGRSSSAAVRSGVGAGVGRLSGTVVKFAIGLAMWLIASIAAFWP